MKKYAIESDWGIGFALNAMADSREEAEAKLKKLKPAAPMDGMVFRIIEEKIPDDPAERFEHVIKRLTKERCCIDDESLNGFSIHISWGDWKHEHMRADFVFGLYGFELVSSEVDEEDGGDCYSAWRTYSPVKKVI